MEQTNIKKESVEQLINEFPTILRRGLVAITLNTLETTDEDLITEDKLIDEDQYVLAVGSLIKDFKPGDKIKLNLDALTVSRQSSYNADEMVSEINIKLQKVGDTNVGIIDERVIEQIYK